MKKILLLLVCLGVSLSAHAQTHTFPATDTNNVFTGTNAFNGRTNVNLASYTIAALPAAASTPIGSIASVTDAFSPGDCTTGLGINLALCRNNGTTWETIGGAGGGAVYPPAGIPVSTGVSWTSPATSTNIIGLFTGTCNSSTFLRADGFCQIPSPGGNVSNSGTPVNGQIGQWTSATTIQGVTTLPTVAVPAFTGDVTNSAGSLATTVVRINGTSLAGLATGLLKNTTATGVPSIATSTDIIADFSGTCNSGTFLRGDGTCNTPAGSGNVSSSGSPTTHQTTVWASSSTILGIGPGTTGFPLVSAGASADPAYAQLSLTAGVTGTLPVANGGTGTASTLVGIVRGGSPLTASELSGDATTTGSNAVVVKKINGVALSGLATGILKNTTTTGVPSIAVASDVLGLWSGSCSSSTFLNGAGACATPPGTISGQANGVIPLATSATGITAQSHFDDGITTAATITSTEPIVAPSFTGGSGCSAAGVTASGGICMVEASSTGWTPTASQDYIRASSTHTLLYSVNAGSEFPLALFSATPAGSKCLRSSGTLGLVAEATNDCGSNVFPLTVSGTVTSGGISYFSSTTAESSSGILNTGFLVKGGGAGGAPTNSLCDEGATTANTLTCTNSAGLKVVNVATGTSPPTCTIGTAGALCQGEGTAPTGAANVDDLYADSTLHCLTAINNNTNVGCLIAANGANTAGASMTLDMSAATALKVPVIAGATAGANGVIDYDSSNANTHIRTNGADSIAVAEAAAITLNLIPKATDSTHGLITASSITDDGKNITTSEVIVPGNKVFVTSDFVDSTTSTLMAITGLTWTLPTSKAVNVSFHCSLLFSQATAAVSDSFGIGVTGTAPTQANASGVAFISASTLTAGTLTALASTTPTAVVTFTPTAITTVWRAELDGTIEQPSNATPGVFNIYASTSTGADNFTVKRGSYCSLF